MESLILPPWEYRGADFDPRPHAQLSSEIGGRTRDLNFKARNGVIYFGEVGAKALWAIPRVFPAFESAESLLETARREIETGNYGRYDVTSLQMTSGLDYSVVCIVRRANGSGWAKEWFEPDWTPFQAAPNSKILDGWNSKRDFSMFFWRIGYRMQWGFSKRRIEPAWRVDVASQWKSGSFDELKRIVEVSFKLLYPHATPNARPGHHLSFEYRAHSPNLNAGLFGLNAGPIDAPPAFKTLWQLIENHFVWVGLQWEEVPLKPVWDSKAQRFVPAPALPPSERDWRWNWHPRPLLKSWSFPAYDSPSAHERLELALELEAWLKGKLSPVKIRNLLKKATSG